MVAARIVPLIATTARSDRFDRPGPHVRDLGGDRHLPDRRPCRRGGLRRPLPRLYGLVLATRERAGRDGAARPLLLRGRGRALAEARHDRDEGRRVLAGGCRRRRSASRPRDTAAQVGGEMSGRVAGLGYATLSVTALGVMNALAYRAGHG